MHHNQNFQPGLHLYIVQSKVENFKGMSYFPHYSNQYIYVFMLYWGL